MQHELPYSDDEQLARKIPEEGYTGKISWLLHTRSPGIIVHGTFLKMGETSGFILVYPYS